MFLRSKKFLLFLMKIHKSMKDELLNLYSMYWDEYIENVRKVSNSASPFLIVPRDNYCTAKNRIMICGQETQGWCNELDNKNPGGIIAVTLR